MFRITKSDAVIIGLCGLEGIAMVALPTNLLFGIVAGLPTGLLAGVVVCIGMRYLRR